MSNTQLIINWCKENNIEYFLVSNILTIRHEKHNTLCLNTNKIDKISPIHLYIDYLKGKLCYN